MSNPRIELKSLKLHDDMSEETQCYSAIIVVDGVPAIRASNQGTGGSDEYNPVTHTPAGNQAYDGAMAKLEAYVKTLPPIPSEYFPDGLEMDIELLVGNLIETHRLKKDEKKFVKQLQQKIFMIDDGKLYTIKGEFSVAAHQRLLAKYPKAHILNALTADAAWAEAKPFLIG